jgi:hypothetical protein
MLDSNEKLFRLLKSKYHVSRKQISLLIETSAFIGKEIAQDVDGIDKLANSIIVIMDEDDGLHAVALIPTIKEIKEECNALLCRLAEHRQSIAAYEGTVMRSKRVVFENTSVPDSLCHFLVSTIRELRRISGIFNSVNIQYFFILIFDAPSNQMVHQLMDF